MEETPQIQTQQEDHHSAEEWTDPGQPAGFWVRAGAAFIDGLILLVALFGVSILLVLAGRAPESSVGLVQFISLVIGCAYYTLLTGLSGQTVGKMAAGIRVVTKTGGAVSYPRALGRWAAYSVASLSIVGFPLAGWNKLRRGLHDFIAGTRVVYLPEVGKGRKAAMASVGVFFFAAAAVLAFMAAENAPKEEAMLEQLKVAGEATGNLKGLRTAVSLYKAEKGSYPPSLEALSQLKDFTVVPALSLPGHSQTNATAVYAGVAQAGKLDGSKLKDTGGWGYVSDPKDPAFGTVFIDCTHTDEQGAAWYQY